ncbi:hypothetical protein ACE6H2_008669 [Prunus campanulata]
MVGESFGPWGSIAVQICAIITNLGSLIIYFIIIGDVLCGSQSEGTLHLGILQEWFGIHWWNSRAYALLFIALFVMLPLVLLRRVGQYVNIKQPKEHVKLLSIYWDLPTECLLLNYRFTKAHFSSVHSVSSGFCCHMFCNGNLRIVQREDSETETPDFAHQVSVFDLFTTIPILVTGFGFHVSVHPIRAELGKPSDMRSAARISLVISIIIYFSIGFSGYLLFGDLVMDDILINFDQSSDSTIGQISNDIVRLSYAVHLLFVFPIMNFSLRANIDELLFPNKPILAQSTSRFLSLTFVLLSFTYIVAIAIPSIRYFFQFMRSTTIVCLSFIFPAALILRDGHGISTRRDNIFV